MYTTERKFRERPLIQDHRVYKCRKYSEISRIMSEAIVDGGKIRLLVEIEGFRHMEREDLLEGLRFGVDCQRAIPEIRSNISGRPTVRLSYSKQEHMTHNIGYKPICP